MSLWKIAWRSIQQRGLASSLTGISMALGVMLVVAVLVIHGAINQSFLNNEGLGYNLVVGAKGGRLDLVLNSVYYLARPIENIPYTYYQEFIDGRFAPTVQTAVPLCLGDTYEEFRVIGTTPEFFDKLDYGGKQYKFASGRNFKAEETFGAVIGATVARDTGLATGDTFQPSHSGGPEAHVHEEQFTVMGVLEPTGTPNDRGLFINMEGFYLIPEHKSEDEVPPTDAPAPHDDHEHDEHADHGHTDHGPEGEHAGHEHHDEHADEHKHAGGDHDHEGELKDEPDVEGASDDGPGDDDESEHAEKDAVAPDEPEKTATADTDAEQGASEPAEKAESDGEDEDHHSDGEHGEEDKHADHDHAGEGEGHAGDHEHDKAGEHEHAHQHEHAHGEEHEHADEHGHEHGDEHGHEHGHGHGHEHGDEHGHEHAHGHDHAHEPVPIEQREVTAVLVLTASIGGAPPELLAPGLMKQVNEGPVAQAAQPIREMSTLFTTFVDPLRIVLLSLTVLIVIVAGIGILVSIYNSMSERRHEIAVMRALGAGRRTVMLIVLAESILLSLAGGLAGWAVGHGLVGLVSPWIADQTGVSIGAAQFVGYELVIIPGLIVLATIVGYLPAMAAYRTDVAKALSTTP